LKKFEYRLAKMCLWRLYRGVVELASTFFVRATGPWTSLVQEVVALQDHFSVFFTNEII